MNKYSPDYGKFKRGDIVLLYNFNELLSFNIEYTVSHTMHKYFGPGRGEGEELQLNGVVGEFSHFDFVYPSTLRKIKLKNIEKTCLELEIK